MATKEFQLTPAPRSEHEEQSDLMARCLTHLVEYPLLVCVFAVPNGAFRNATTALRSLQEGQKPGVPDLVFPVARGGYFGYWQEQKVKGNYPTKRQKAWHRLLRSTGYRVDVSHGCDAGWLDLMQYYHLPLTPLPPDCPILTPAERLSCLLEMLPDWAHEGRLQLEQLQRQAGAVTLSGSAALPAVRCVRPTRPLR